MAESSPDPRANESGRPSAFFETHLPALRETAALGPMLDLACGRGRHSIAAARAGLRVLALDRNAPTLDELSKFEPEPPGSIEVMEADLETGDPPDVGRARFGAVVVSRYLHRPLMPWIEGLLAPGGLLLYETFTTAQRALGWGPKRDAFLLAPRELSTAFPGLESLVYEEGPSLDEPSAQTARLLARRPD